MITKHCSPAGITTSTWRDRHSLDVADRFLTNAESSFAQRARQPTRVKNFDNYLVVDEPRPGGVSIVRVLHAASNRWHLPGFES